MSTQGFGWVAREGATSRRSTLPVEGAESANGVWSVAGTKDERGRVFFRSIVGCVITFRTGSSPHTSSASCPRAASSTTPVTQDPHPQPVLLLWFPRSNPPQLSSRIANVGSWAILLGPAACSLVCSLAFDPQATTRCKRSC
jgi:hypothetical protein